MNIDLKRWLQPRIWFEVLVRRVLSPSNVIHHSTYSVSLRIYSWVYGQRWWRFGLFQKEITRLREFCYEHDLALKKSGAEAGFMLHNYMRYWQFDYFTMLPDLAFQQHSTVVGEAFLDDAIKRHKGVILAGAHWGNFLLICPYFKARKQKLLVLREASKEDRKNDIAQYQKENPYLDWVLISPTATLQEKVKSLYKIKKVLKEGGCVFWMPDTHQAQDFEECLFLGKSRKFTTSFAQTALDTGAVVIPVFSQITLASREMFIEFHRPLMAQNKQDLVNAYVALLEQYWRKQPELISVHQLYWHDRLVVTPPEQQPH